MEVSGRKHTSGGKPSTGDFQLYCEPCDDEGERTKAGGYCKQCREYLCKPCIKLHRRGKLGKLHEVLEDTFMPATRPVIAHDDCTEIEICPIHKTSKEPIKFYCPSHDDIGCGDCIVLTHRTCKVDYIEDASKGFKDSREFKDLLTLISTLEEHIKKIEDTTNKTSKSNADAKQTALDSIRKFRAEFISYLDKREQELVTEIEKIKAEDDNLLADIRSRREDSKKHLEEIKREIENNQEEAKNLFITAKRRKSELVNLEKLITDSLQEVKLRKWHYTFNRDMTIEEIMTSERPLGSLGSDTMYATLDLSKVRCIPCNDINIHTSEDTTKCYITGMAFLTQGELVLADWNNKAVKVVNTTARKVISRLPMPHQPYDVTVLPDKQVAVTTPNEKKIHILAAHNNKLSILRQFQVSGDCCGIDYKLRKLAVIYTGKVEIMDTNGVVINLIQSNDTNKISGSEGYVMFTRSGQEVLVTCNDYSVKKLSLQGDVLASYSAADVRRPSGIAVTGAGGVLVCGRHSHTVHAVCEDDKRSKTLLSKQDGLTSPRCLCVSEETGTLYVGSFKDVLQTFKLQQ